MHRHEILMPLFRRSPCRGAALGAKRTFAGSSNTCLLLVAARAVFERMLDDGLQLRCRFDHEAVPSVSSVFKATVCGRRSCATLPAPNFEMVRLCDVDDVAWRTGDGIAAGATPQAVVK